VHVIDVSGSEGRDPIEDIELINAELARYDADLASRPQIIAANKYDLVEDEAALAPIEAYAREKGYELYYLSAGANWQVRELVNAVYARLQTLPPLTVYESEVTEDDLFASEAASREVTITRRDGVYYVEGDWLCQMMQTIRFDDRESMMYFQRLLKGSGIIDQMREFGIRDGDTVDLYGLQFEFVS
jgi:GTP-binding protein